MKLGALLLTLLFMAGCSGCASVPSHDALRVTTLRLEFVGGLCSGTAIGPDLILSAAHCFDGGALVTVNGQAAKVIGITRKDATDTAWVRIDRKLFKRWAKLGRAPAQGDRIRWWGNPMGAANVYRQGYVSRAQTDGLVIDATICRGDSGSGLFNDRGQVVGIVSAMNDLAGCTFMFGFPVDRA